MDNTNVIEGNATAPSQLNLAGVMRIPAVRQVMLLVGVAAAIAAGFAIVLWSQTPGYTQLYGEMSGAEAAEVTDALRTSGIEFRVNETNGSILVPAANLHDARMQLASQGLGQSAGAGMAMLAENSKFGQSQFIENARYQHALETELGQTISSLGVVREARVHLALPKQTTFVRDRKSASASVLIRLARGSMLEADQAGAIVNLVAGSVANLSPGDVTVIDQNGRLLSGGEDEAVDAQATKEFKYARKLEAEYRSRIEELLTPLVGVGRVRAQVDADIELTVAEETRESYDPAQTVVRSEQLFEEQRTGNANLAAGVPGAMSNQPPEAGGIPVEDATNTQNAETAAPQNRSRNSIRNFEIGRTISRTRPSVSRINKLSVAVLIDNSPLGSAPEGEGEGEAGDAGAPAPLTDAEIARYTSLVREAVGFDEERGDTVVVVGDTFRPALPSGTEVEGPPLWEQPLVRDILKQVLGAALVLALLFGIVRPMLRNVMAPHAGVSGTLPSQEGSLAAAAAAPQLAAAAASLPPPKYEEKVAAAKNITGHDPARVAQLVKQWVAADGG